MIAAPLRIVTPEFADDPTFDIEAHVRVVAVAPPGDERALLDLCGALAEQPLDRARPLWEFTLIEGLPDGRCALLQKVHHVIADGEGALRLSLALVDFERDPESADLGELVDIAEARPEPVVSDRRDTPMRVTKHAIADATTRGVGVALGALSGTRDILRNPATIPGSAADAAKLAGSFQRQVIVTAPARSDVMFERSLRRRFDTCRALVARGARRRTEPRRQHQRRLRHRTGGRARPLPPAHGFRRARAATGDAGQHARAGRSPGNERVCTCARVLVPIQPAYDVATLFKMVSERLVIAKQESALSAAGGLAALAAPLPTSVLVAMTRSQTRTIDFAASNLRGSSVPLFLGGGRIIASYPFGPRTASALNITMLSYCDELHLGCNIDPAAVTDVEAFLGDLESAYFDLTSYA